MAKNVLVTWVLPTQRESGFPLDPADIKHVVASLSVDSGATFNPVGNPILPTEVQELALADVDIGDWVVRLVVFDTADRQSAPVDTPFTVPDETAPGQVVNVSVSLG